MNTNLFYFTFKHTDRNREGKRLKDYFVEVHASTREEANEKFYEQFATKELPHPLCFNGMHPEAQFQKNFYPMGVYKTIK